VFQRKGASQKAARQPRRDFDIYADLRAEGEMPPAPAPASSREDKANKPRNGFGSRSSFGSRTSRQASPPKNDEDEPGAAGSAPALPTVKAGVLSAIHPSQRREGRFEIFIDGAKIAEVTADTIGELKLQTQLKQTLSAETIEAILQAERALSTYDRALAVLGFRSRSVKELRRSLQQKGEPLDLIDAAIEKLTRSGFLNDESYARQFTRAKVTGQGFGRRRIEQELSVRGVGKDTARTAIHEVISQDHIDENAVLLRVAEKRLRSLARLEPEVQRRRLYGFLARRGYSHDSIGKVIRRLVNNTRPEDLEGIDGNEPD
jgi:regulatory protein